MTGVAALLLALIAAVHYGADLLAYSYENHDAARKGLYYVLRSFEGAAQYALIAALAILLVRRQRLAAPGMKAKEPGCLKGAAVPLSSAALVVVVCGWGITEHLQAAACKISIGISQRHPHGQPLSGICDDLVGLPLYALGMGVVAFIAAVIAAHSRENEHG